jgi:DNA-binding PadR family transcriptional regulator
MSVRLGLLALLDSADMYGYQLKTSYEAWTGAAWSLNVGQVYSTLDRLERDGLISAVARVDAPGAPPSDAPVAAGGGREHKYYAITHAGRDTLSEWFTTAPEEAELPRDELIAKILLAMSGGRERAMEVILRQRTSLTQALQARRRGRRNGTRLGPRYARPAADEPLSSLSPVLVDDAVVARTEAELRWLDLCEARILRIGQNITRGGHP